MAQIHKQFTDEQVIEALKKLGADTTLQEVSGAVGIKPATLAAWAKRVGRAYKRADKRKRDWEKIKAALA